MLNKELRLLVTGADQDTTLLDAAQNQLLAFNTNMTAMGAANEKRARDLAAQLAGADFAEAAPQTLLAEFDTVAAASGALLDAIAPLIAFINSRVPKAAVEDNIGVEVQMLVLKALKEMEAVLTGKDDKTSFAGSAGAKAAYLKARCDIEDKLKPPPAPKDGEKPAAGPAPSQRAFGAAFDAATAAEVARSWVVLRRYGSQVVQLLVRNIEQLNKPRRDTASFLG